MVKRFGIIGLVLAIQLIAAQGSFCQGQLTREDLILNAKLIMADAGNCALITIDKEGLSRARAMDPFTPEDDMVVWLGTNSQSRKVDQIRNNNQVLLYYFDKEGGSYVIISGKARIVNDPDKKKSYWKYEWKGFYPDREKDYLLIEVTPQWIELVSEKYKIFVEGGTWQPPIIRF